MGAGWGRGLLGLGLGPTPALARGSGSSSDDDDNTGRTYDPLTGACTWQGAQGAIRNLLKARQR
eukprot:15483825-Alexandrium_andersonii.AAC.1